MTGKTKILLFNGPPGSGKDTAVTVLRELGGIDMHMEKFARSVKEGCHGLFNLVNDEGKVLPHDTFEAVKNKPRAEFMGMTPREAYIWYSEDVMKPKFGKDIFGSLTVKRLADQNVTGLVGITDSGFAEEAGRVIQRYGAHNTILVRLHREGHDFTGDSRSYLSLDIESHDVVNSGDPWEYCTALQDTLARFMQEID